MFRRIAALMLFTCAATAWAQEDRTLEECVFELLPRPEENKWLEIPWRMDLLRARYEANEAGKPIFMWIMNGDPLGCT